VVHQDGCYVRLDMADHIRERSGSKLLVPRHHIESTYYSTSREWLVGETVAGPIGSDLVMCGQ
jgi:hypothetical protein